LPQPGLCLVEAVLVDHRPNLYQLGVHHVLVGDRFGPVIDKQHEGRCQDAEADEAQQKSDHERLIMSR
jgi:hypothetical protein